MPEKTTRFFSYPHTADSTSPRCPEEPVRRSHRASGRVAVSRLDTQRRSISSITPQTRTRRANRAENVGPGKATSSSVSGQT
eukprot:29350-Pelagococcus_subviridis.AAC.3